MYDFKVKTHLRMIRRHATESLFCHLHGLSSSGEQPVRDKSRSRAPQVLGTGFIHDLKSRLLLGTPTQAFAYIHFDCARAASSVFCVPEDDDYHHGSIQNLLAYSSEHMAPRTRNRRKYASRTDAPKQDSDKQDARPKRQPKGNTSERESCQLEAIKGWKPTARAPTVTTTWLIELLEGEGEKKRTNNKKTAEDIRSSSTSRDVKPLIYSQGGKAREQECKQIHA